MPSVFTKIINREIPAAILVENDLAIAFLDVQPLSAGHSLVVPKREVPSILELSETEIREVFLTVQQVTAILSKSLKPAGFTIGINHGQAAGQAVNHLHIHIVPRYEGDGGGNIHSLIKNPPKISVAEIHKKILSA